MIKENLLQRVLEAKEERVHYQRKLINQYQLPLVSFTLNLPGGYFQYRLWKKIMNTAVEAIETFFNKDILYVDIRVAKWGPEGFWVVSLPITNAKEKAIYIEENHPLGRLFDIDIIDSYGKPISRRNLDIAERKCIVCNEKALECYLEKKHTLQELQINIEKIINKGLNPDDENQ